MTQHSKLHRHFQYMWESNIEMVDFVGAAVNDERASSTFAAEEAD